MGNCDTKVGDCVENVADRQKNTQTISHFINKDSYMIFPDSIELLNSCLEVETMEHQLIYGALVSKEL